MIRERVKHLMKTMEFHFSAFFLLAFVTIPFVFHAIKSQSISEVILEPANQQYILFKTSSFMVPDIFIWILIPSVSALCIFGMLKYNEISSMGGYFLHRTSRFRYYFGGFVISFSVPFVLFFLSLALNQLLCIIAYPWSSYSNGSFNLTEFRGLRYLLFPEMYINSPYLYSFTNIFLVSLTAGCFSLLFYSLVTLKPSKRNVFFIFPFMFYMAASLVAALVGNFGYIPAYYLYANNGLDDMDLSVFVGFLGVMLLISLILTSYRVWFEKDEL
ncbi:hypothetical protein [Guggenheimella bovis]